MLLPSWFFLGWRDGHDNGVREGRRDVGIFLKNLGLLFVDSKREGGGSGFKRVFME